MKNGPQQRHIHTSYAIRISIRFQSRDQTKLYNMQSKYEYIHMFVCLLSARSGGQVEQVEQAEQA